jgi:hypothetical protein
MMRRLAARSAAILPVALVLAWTAAPAQAHNKQLTQAYSYTVGDDIADRAGGIFDVVAGLEASTLAYYDRKEQNIITYVVGSAEDVEGAKREIEAFVQAVREYLVPYAKSQHGVVMTDKDVTLVYYNDGGDGAPFEVVRRENGEFKTPPPGDEKE